MRIGPSPKKAKEPTGLGPIVERWNLGTKNKPDDAAAVAAAVKEAGLTVVDPKANEAARKAAEQRAVMQDAAPEKVAEALRPFAVDAILRVNVTVSPPVLVPSANVWVVKWQMTVDRIDGRNKTKAKESWRLPVDPADARASTGKGETAEKACRAVIEQITSRFSRSLREKVLGPAGAAADKKAN